MGLWHYPWAAQAFYKGPRRPGSVVHCPRRSAATATPAAIAFLTGQLTGTQSPPCLYLGPTQPVAALFASRTPILPAQRKERKEKAPFVNIVHCPITSLSESKNICPPPRHLHLLPTTPCKYLSRLSSIYARTANANNTCSNPSTASNKTNTPPHTAH
jgi:hypothetical protein